MTPIDKEAIRARLNTYHMGYLIRGHRQDVEALLAEVERLENHVNTGMDYIDELLEENEKLRQDLGEEG